MDNIELAPLPPAVQRPSSFVAGHKSHSSLRDLGSQSYPATAATQPPTTRRSTLTVDNDAEAGSGVGPVISALPPVDGGKDAWLFLLGATTIETLVWGLPFSVGILHVYWTETLFQGSGESTITLAATLQTGLLYMGGGIVGPLFAAFPKWQRQIQGVGLLAAVVSMISCAFVTQPWHLIITIGAFYPFAVAYYLPCATLLFEWFQTRRGLASGVLFAGTGFGGTIFPFIVSSLLGRFGYKAAMISLGIGYGVIGCIAMIPIKRRIPLTRFEGGGHRRTRIEWSFLRKRTLYAGLATILFTSLGNFVPSLWLPSFANDINVRRPSGVGLIAIMNAASIPGNALLGYLSDRFPLRFIILLSCVGSSLSCLVLWGFGTNVGLLVAFVLSFGAFALSFSTLWPNMIVDICGDDPNSPALVFSIFTFFRGVGNITSGPISDALLKVDVLRGTAGAYGFKNYGILLIYTGLAILGGGATGLVFE